MERFLVSPMEEVDRGVEIGDEVIHLPLILLLLLLLLLLLFFPSLVNVIVIANLIIGRWV